MSRISQSGTRRLGAWGAGLISGRRTTAAELLESLALEKLNPTEVGKWYEHADILVNEMSLNRHRYTVFKDFCELAGGGVHCP